jgi:chaperonin GroEL (HSP60 family)
MGYNIEEFEELFNNCLRCTDVSSETNRDREKVNTNISYSSRNAVNVVSEDKLRSIQQQTLADVASYLEKTFGPMGSNTKIIKGNNKETITSSYSKDGLKVLKNISNLGPIEMSIIEELVELTRHVESEVGDGTTSTVILSSIIFDNLVKIQKKYTLPPFQLIRYFEKVVGEIKNIILSNKRECTIRDIVDISNISTNGNKEISDMIKTVYEQYGMDVDLSVGISNTEDTVVKSYDGLTITEGFADPVYITNKAKGTSEIHNARVYHFVDPIDTVEMISYFEAILKTNIYDAIEEDKDPIPTVITCPRMSKDMSSILKNLTTQLYQFDKQGVESSKPPILIITNVVASDEVIMDDIANLCGCKSIRKYIDPKMLKRDQENGSAPTLETVSEFYGVAELVVADSKKTKFINPINMNYENPETGEIEPSPIYNALINFLETEIANAKSTDTAGEIGLLKKRLSALKSNMVDLLVGGITITERDYKKDLVEDAVKNCKSAAKYGVGRAANFEGLNASLEVVSNFDEDDTVSDIEKDIAKAIANSYIKISKILYSTINSDEKYVYKCINVSLAALQPLNINSLFLSYDKDDAHAGITDDVKCSIMLDIEILDTISKIITMMVTCNQCLLQAPQLNNY